MVNSPSTACRFAVVGRRIRPEFHSHYQRVFDTGNDPNGSDAIRTRLDINIKHPLQALRPGHGGAPFGGCLIVSFISRLVLVSLAPFRGRD
jgi:hypothetical protein